MAEILVADSLPEITQLCETVLIKHGHEVKRVSTKDQFMEFVKNENFNLLIIGLGMPEESGIQYANKALKINPKVGIVIMTGAPNFTHEEREWIKVFPFRILFKPFPPKDLEEVVETYMKERR